MMVRNLRVNCLIAVYSGIPVYLGTIVLAISQWWPLLRGCFLHKCSFGTRVPGHYIDVGLSLRVHDC